MNKYWENRISQVMQTVYNSQEQKNMLLLIMYKKSLRKVKFELSELYEKMDNENISLSEAYKYNKLNNVEKQVDKIIKNLGKKENDFFKSNLTNNYSISNDLVKKELNKIIDISFSLIDKKAVEKAILYPWSGTNYSTRIWRNKNKLAYTLQDTITRNLAQGNTYAESVKEIKEIFDTSSSDALRLIRTETSHIVNAATIDRYKESGVVKRIQIWTAPDERRCKVCKAQHEKIYDLDKAPILPFHCNCRCCILPVIDNFNNKEGDFINE